MVLGLHLAKANLLVARVGACGHLPVRPNTWGHQLNTVLVLHRTGTPFPRPPQLLRHRGSHGCHATIFTMLLQRLWRPDGYGRGDGRATARPIDDVAEPCACIICNKDIDAERGSTCGAKDEEWSHRLDAWHLFSGFT
jgi:hypothetical protein